MKLQVTDQPEKLGGREGFSILCFKKGSRLKIKEIYFQNAHNFPKKLSPEKGVRFWYGVGTVLIRTKYDGSGAPLSIR
jgi:hypothetical protein